MKLEYKDVVKFEENMDNITEALIPLKNIVRKMDDVSKERAKYWISSIEMAISKNHSWLGGCMFTMEDTLGELIDDYESREE